MNKIERLEQLERQLEGVSKLIEEMKADREAAKEDEEWPQAGDEYWAGVADSGCVTSVLYDGDSYDDYRKAIGDMHRTKEEAEAYRAYRMSPRTVMRDRIQMWVDEYNGDWVADWMSEKQDKHYVTCAGYTNLVGRSESFRPFAMKDPEGAERLLEKFGLDNILWACGGPEPGGE